MNKLIRITIILFVLLFQVGCDQISKKVVRNNIAKQEQITVIEDFLTLTKVENTGAFLSLGHRLPELLRILLLIIFPVLLLGAAIFYLFHKSGLSLLSQTAIACLVGGGIGNLIDRILYGSVTDFLHMDFYIFQTGVFNMADVSIMAGMFMLIADRLQQSRLVENNTGQS